MLSDAGDSTINEVDAMTLSVAFTAATSRKVPWRIQQRLDCSLITGPRGEDPRHSPRILNAVAASALLVKLKRLTYLLGSMAFSMLLAKLATKHVTPHKDEILLKYVGVHMFSIVSGMNACPRQQESQIHRLTTGISTSNKSTLFLQYVEYVECMNKMSKVKERNMFSKVWDDTVKRLGSLEIQEQRKASNRAGRSVISLGLVETMSRPDGMEGTTGTQKTSHQAPLWCPTNSTFLQHAHVQQHAWDFATISGRIEPTESPTGFLTSARPQTSPQQVVRRVATCHFCQKVRTYIGAHIPAEKLRCGGMGQA
ncbi:hypothetical protein H257_04317 [Aphanomyces astaci]|uniref:Uncharacterized protein n=1 Tax=Aphanomyces astaci TaxID=112090 RepID=W4GV88_APHAT|nr:hypothetical protein H257_04317 [Aphanomyces astaci]ETV83625.1 hypothetical protein H257_04317 [Aphanomyces astaci]|eukprot:XP_009827055.1 hypothetical protein H257_04317 [Aphanomyces astaci]